MTVEPLALLDCFSGLFRWGAEGDERAILYLDLGSQNTQVVISHGRNVVFIRNMPCGGEEIEKIFADKMGASVDEARQLRRDVAAGREAGSGRRPALRIADGLASPDERGVRDVPSVLQFGVSVAAGSIAWCLRVARHMTGVSARRWHGV